MQKPLLHANLWACQKLVHLSHCEGGHITHYTSNLWSLLGAINSVSSLLKFFQVTVLLLRSHWLTLVTRLWPLKLIHVIFLDYQYSSISASFVMKVNLQWVNIQVVYSRHYTHPTIHRHPVYQTTEMVSSKFNSEQSATTFLNSSHTLMRHFGQWMQHTQKEIISS